MSKRVSNEPELEISQTGTTVIPLSLLRVDETKNLRRYGPKAAEIKELAESILATGLINPLSVRELTEEEMNGGEHRYELVAGYQRTRAINYLNEQGHEGYTSVEVKILEPATATDHLLLNLDENLKRNNISPIDCAHAAKVLVDTGMTQGDVAKRMRKSGGWVSQILSLLTLRPEVQKKIHEGKVPFHVAREFPTLPEGEQDRLIADAEASGGKVEGGAVAESREAKGKKKGKARGKAAVKSTDPKNVSSKSAILTMTGLVKGIEEQEGKRNKAEMATVEVLGVVSDFLAGKFGEKALKNKVMAAVA